MKHRYVYEAILEKGERGGYFVSFPDLPDAFTQARTKRQAALRATEVMELTLADYLADDKTPPKATFGHAVAADAQLVLVSSELTSQDVDLMAYVTSSEAAKLLGIGRSRICQMANNGLLESIGTGTSRRISLRSINNRLAHPQPAGRPQSTNSINLALA
jgi:antitoxin HicB